MCPWFLVHPASIWFLKFPHEKVISNAVREKYSRYQGLEKHHSCAGSFFPGTFPEGTSLFSQDGRKLLCPGAARLRHSWGAAVYSVSLRGLVMTRVPFAPSSAEGGAETETRLFPLLMIPSHSLLRSNRPSSDIPSCPSWILNSGTVPSVSRGWKSWVFETLALKFLVFYIETRCCEEGEDDFTVIAWTRHQKMSITNRKMIIVTMRIAIHSTLAICPRLC